MDNKRCQVLCCTLNVAWPASVCTVPRLAATLMRLPFPCQHHLTVLPDQHHLTVLPNQHHLTVLPDQHHLTVLPDQHHLTVLPNQHHLTVLPNQHHLTVLPDQHHLTVLPSVIRFGAVIYFHKPTNKTGTNHAGSGSHSPNVLRRSSHSGIRHRTLKNYLY